MYNCSDGDDFNTKTIYKREKNPGDRLKVILLQCYDLAFRDNLQIYEIKALINALIDQHIIEHDALND